MRVPKRSPQEPESLPLRRERLDLLDHALAPQVPWIADRSGKICHVGAGWTGLTGHTPAVLLGFTWSRLIHPDDLQAYLRAFETSPGQPNHIRLRLQLANGSHRWFRLRLPTNPEHEDAIGRMGIVEDVHDEVLAQQKLEEREAHYRTALALSPLMHWTADADGSMVELSPRWTEMTGRSVSESLGHGWLENVHPDDLPDVARTILHRHEGGARPEVIFRVLTADGTYRWMRGRGSPVIGPGDGVSGWYGSTEDIHDQVIAEQALRESEENHRYTLELNPQIPWTADAKGSVTGGGSQWRELIGAEGKTALGEGWTAALHPDDVDSARSAWSQSVATGEPFDTRYRLRLKDGSYQWFRTRAGARRDADGSINRWYGLVENIHGQVEAECALHERQQELLRSEKRHQLISRATDDLLWDWDIDADVIIWNEVLVSRYGYPPTLLKSSGNWWKEQVHPADLERVLPDLEKLFTGTEDQYLGEYRFRTADGTYAPIYDRSYVVRDDSGRPVRMVGAMQDLTGRKNAEDQLRWSATHDTLTSLPNRRLFQERLKEAMDSAGRRGRSIGVLVLDIDHFKQVNDTLGHDAGDTLLKTFAERLREGVRSTDTVARLGGDEMAIILPELRSEQDIPRLVESLQSRLREPFVYQGRILDCRASLGISIFPEHGTSAEALLQSADIALYAAKSAGRGGHMVFRPEQRHDLQQRSRMINIARDAIAADRVLPFYQPKIDLGSGAVAGLEALLRWRDDRGRVQLPNTILAAFDDLEVAADISNNMIDRAIRDMRGWLDRGIDFGHVAINAAAAEFRRDHFAERLLERLRAAEISPKHLEVEVTETVFLGRGADYVERALRLLSAEGVRIALDDFGTGYASLRHLKQFPVDLIKIDRSFVRDMNDDSNDGAIVRAVISLSQNLGIKVVAEGVETQDQADELGRLGCNYGQGYLYSRAVPARKVAALVRAFAGRQRP